VITNVTRELEKVTRLSYGRLVAILAARTGNLHEAEDALSDALINALKIWPETGAPTNPEAWLITTAQRRWMDTKRHKQVAKRFSAYVALLEDERFETKSKTLPDERLKLMFVCTHPSIEPTLRAPLMLQAVLGLDVRRMASAFLVSPGTLGQRLTRAKVKISIARIPFEIPEMEILETRISDVLAAIYAGYSIGLGGISTGDQKAADLADESIWLASLIAELLPEAAEAQGLIALMLFAEARRPARIDQTTGSFVPLSKQNTSLWDIEMIENAEQYLRRASLNLSLGRYQLEASIQAVHTARRISGATNWPQILLLYQGLIQTFPTIGALTGYAVAISEVEGAITGLKVLDTIDEKLRKNYQPWWAVRAHLAAKEGNRDVALQSFDRAMGLCEDASVRLYLFDEKNKLLS
jgi:RNA polymerase sigma-70 factor, ECF subfamily